VLLLAFADGTGAENAGPENDVGPENEGPSERIIISCFLYEYATIKDIVLVNGLFVPLQCLNAASLCNETVLAAMRDLGPDPLTVHT